MRSQSITYKHETRSLLAWSKLFHMKKDVLYRRLRDGWSVHDTFNTPIRDASCPGGNSSPASATEASEHRRTLFLDGSDGSSEYGNYSPVLCNEGLLL